MSSLDMPLPRTQGARGRRLRIQAARQAGEAGRLGRLAGPIIAAGGLNMAISLTDTAMMAWLDPRALAGGAAVSDLYSLAFYFATGVLAAVTPLSAAAIGAGAPRRVGAIVASALVPLVLLAAVGYWLVSRSVDLMSGLGISLPEPDAAADYAGYMAWAFALMLVFALGRSTLAALGRGRPPMVILGAAVPINALANYTFMYGAFGAPEMGLAGAGAASALVAAVAALSTLGYLAFAPALRSYGFASGLRRIELSLILSVARTGLMIAVTTVAETGVFLCSTIIVGMVAAESLPAHALVFRGLGLGYSLVVGFGQAVTVRVAMAFGAGDRRQEGLVRQTADLLALALAGTYLAVFGVAGPWLAGRIAAESAEAAAVLAEAASMMPLAGLALAALTFGATSAAILRGRTDVTGPAMLMLAGYWLVGFGSIVLLTHGMGTGGVGVWFGLCAGAIAAAGGAWTYRAWRERQDRKG